MSTRPASGFFTVAMGAGLIHGTASLYWALGGTWLLATVGQFTVEMHRDGGPLVPLVLGAIAAVKVAAAVIPWADQRTAPMHRWVRLVSWLGASVVLLWGGAGVAGAWGSVVLGHATWADSAMLGHALLWDPLFVVWGVALWAGLWVTRARREAARAVHPGSRGRGESEV